MSYIFLEINKAIVRAIKNVEEETELRLVHFAVRKNQ